MSQLKTRGPRGTIWIGAVLLGLAPAACGEGTGPVETGRIAAVLLDNPASEVAVQATPFGWLAHHKSFGADYYHGTLAASVELKLSTDGNEYFDAALEQAHQVALQAEGASSALLAGELPAGSYRHVRLVLRGAVAALEAGGEIGGSELDQTATLSVAAGLTVTVDFQLDQGLVIGANRQSTLVFDLNTERWVTEDNLIAGEVGGTEVSRAISVGVSSPGVSSSASGA
jgi:hypothetical protein